MNEAQTRAELIDPALKGAGCGVMDGSRVQRGVIAPGRLLATGKHAQKVHGPTAYMNKHLSSRGVKIGKNRPLQM